MRRFAWPGVVVVLVGCGRPPAAGAAGPVAVAPAPRPVVFEDLAGKTPAVPSPAYRKAPEADRAFAVLDAALEKVWELPDPRDGLAELILTANEVDPVRTCDRVRAAGVRLQKLKLPPARRVVWESFAAAVAPQDRNLRDALLRLAVAEARRSLADPALWAVPPGQPRGKFGDPQRSLDGERQLLEFRVRLWEAVPKAGGAGPAAVDLLAGLLADAKAKGNLGSDAIVSYQHLVARGLADLDADLFLAVAPKVWDKEAAARMCGERAYARWVDRRRDAFTGAYARHAVGKGVARSEVLRLFAHYDLAGAYEAAVKLPDDSTDKSASRLTPLSDILALWAWRDPDAALAAAEKETVASTRRDLIERVAEVWAQKKPEAIERAVKNQDNEVRRTWARDQAAAELAWRKAGNPPRDTPETAPRPFKLKTADAAGKPWVPPDDLKALLADPARAAEADRRLRELAYPAAQAGPADHAVDILNHVRSPQWFVYTAPLVARALIRRDERD